MSAPALLRNQFGDLYGSSALPVLEEIFMNELLRHENKREQLFKVVSSDRDIWQSSEVHDMPLHQIVAEGTNYSFDRPQQGASKTLTHDKYGLGFSISEEAVEDGRFDMIADAIRKMAESALESQEVSAMNVFNNGFLSELAADGVAVFSTAHTLPRGGTFRNRPTAFADLSQSSLDEALADFDTIFVGDTGIIKKVQPRILLVHSSNKRYAMELVGSDLKPDTADNNMNSIKPDGLRVISSPHLSDEDAWFVLDEPSKTGLRIVSRTGIETKASDPSVGFMTDSIFYKSRYRESIGVTHAYSIYGNQGAGS